MKNNVIYQFIIELVVRLKSKSPKFFKIIQHVALAVTLFTGLPEFLESVGVTNLPEWATFLQSKIAGIIGVVAFILAGLPIDQTPTDKPDVVLPFTDKVNEAKKEEKLGSVK